MKKFLSLVLALVMTMSLFTWSIVTLFTSSIIPVSCGART